MRRTLLFMLLLPLFLPTPARGQEDKVPQGVRLGFIYKTGYRPKLAVRPVEAQGIAGNVSDRVYDILRRDLDYSDRFEMATTPLGLAGGSVDYKAWNDLGVVFLVTGQLQPSSSGYTLRVALHDVVYGNVKKLQAFELPPANDDGFRMAAHAVSDEVVRWATGQPGGAASRIVFRQTGPDGDRLLMVDSDGENLHRVASGSGMVLSPVWKWDGSGIAYSIYEPDRNVSRILAMPLSGAGGDGGRPDVIVQSPGLTYAPAWAPDGRHVAYSRWENNATRIYSYDASTDCCLKRLTGGPRDDMSPTFSPDGRRIAFNSNRLGQPQIYVMNADGGDATLLSPFVYGEPGYYTSPDWQPTGSLVVFHGRSRGEFQIMIADASKPGATVQQITDDGRSEDPSWAPDGRHIVFAGIRSGKQGLYVIDSVTGRLRPLAAGGGRYELPDWSPTLRSAAAAGAGG